MCGIFKDNLGIVTIREHEQLFGLSAGAGPDRWALPPDRRRSAGECAGEGCRERFVRVIIPGSPTPKPEPRTGHPEARASERPGECNPNNLSGYPALDPETPTVRPRKRARSARPPPRTVRIRYSAASPL